MIIRGKILLMLVVLILFSCSHAFARGPFETGEGWLSWSNDERQAFVSAYILAYSRGFRDGCQTGLEAYSAEKPSGAVEKRCTGKVHKFSKDLEDYTETITQYYHTYPNDRLVPIFRLIEGLADDRNLRVEEMHRYYGSTQ